MTNLNLCKTADSEEYTAKTRVAAVKDMTAEAYLECVLEAKLKMGNGADVSELERLLCDDKFERRVKELRQASHKALANVMFASKMKELGHVQAESVFESTWKELQMTIHDKSLLSSLTYQNGNKVTLHTFLDFNELHQNVTLFIPGKTRKEKSELAKYICNILAYKYQKERYDPIFRMTHTLDSLRTHPYLMLPSVPMLLGDTGGDVSNDQQLIYSSVSMGKSSLHIKDTTQNRARNDDLMWAARPTATRSKNGWEL